MFWNNEMPSLSTLFSTYASVAASLMFFRSMVNEFIPKPIRAYLFSFFHYFFKAHYSSDLTLIFEEASGSGSGFGMCTNEIFDAAERYLCTKISPATEKLKISKRPKEKNLTIQLYEGEKVSDSFQGMELKWKFVGADRKDEDGMRSFELCFPKKQRDLVLGSYIPFVVDKAKVIKDSTRTLKMHTLKSPGGGGCWDSVVLEHPSTFDTLAMPPELKRSVIEDLNSFVKRKEFYKRVGRAWKRGYLLYGPPGTGKSSLVAAMANYLRFDVYDLQLANVMRDSDLRRLLLGTANKSILVIEDIDCSVSLPDRIIAEDSRKNKHSETQSQLTLSGLLNFIDGLWSSFGDERIIIFTTNHKDRLDPALLRPGRMDMHIHMSYCTFHGFKLLATNYLGISGDHKLYSEIEKLLETTEVTPAQVAEEFMCEDVDAALEGLLKLLKKTKMEGDNKNQDKE